MKYFSFIAALLCAMFLCAVPSLAGAEKAPPARDLPAEAAQFFKDLQERAPELYQRLEQHPDLFPDMLRTVMPGIEPAPPETASAPAAAKAPLYPARLIRGNTIFYARIDRIDEASYRKLLEEMQTTARLAVRPVGAILDLRSADSGDFDAVKRFLAIFTISIGKKPHFFQKIPLAVLCGGKTCGPAELLTVLLERSRLGISLGGAGKGNIFPRKKIFLNGREYLVPQIPDFAKDIQPGAHKPMIMCPAYPQIPFADIGKLPADSDPLIRRASDLLLSLHAIQGK